MAKKFIDSKFNTLGLKIKQLRKLKGLTQEKLSELIDIDSKLLSRLETGRCLPNLMVLKKLSNLFEYDFLKFIDNEKNEKIEVPDRYFMQSVSILKSARNKKESMYYL